jgi:hypothetical protein
LSENGSINDDSIDGKISITWAGENIIEGDGVVLVLQFRSIEGGKTMPTITGGFFQSQSSNVINGLITASYLYGDIDANNIVDKNDAELVLQYSIGLDPINEIDPQPWENWRINTANVDGLSSITANDATMILKYASGIIDKFPVEKSVNLKNSSLADIKIVINDNGLDFISLGEVYGLNLFMRNNFENLGQPHMVHDNEIEAFNINDTIYAIGIANSIHLDADQVFMSIPFTAKHDYELTLDLIINGHPETVKIDIPTSINIIKESSFFVYPVPANNRLYISGMDQDIMVRIYNLQGKMVKNKVTVNNQIDVSSLRDGIYILEFDYKGERIVMKFIKQQ